MEEERAAAYYDELTRKGSGAARFKQGLGFSSAATTTDNDPPPPARGSALPSSSSFMSTFVKASSSPREPLITIEVEDRKTQILNIQNKLKKKEKDPSSRVEDEGSGLRGRRVDDDRECSRGRYRSSSREGRRYRSPDKRRSRSRSRSRSRYRSRRMSRSRSRSRKRRGSRSRSRSRDKSTRRSRSRSRSYSPRERRRVESGRGSNGGGERGRRSVKKEGKGVIDYASLIHGYENMTPADKVKAKMKLQLSQTVEKDTKVGSGSHWERFDFNKDAPLDDIEATDDDASLVKHIGQSFRFTSLEAKRENQIENAHDEAMFGVPVRNPSYSSESGKDGGSENENDNKGFKDEAPTSSLINEKVLSKQQGSWRDRASKKFG